MVPADPSAAAALRAARPGRLPRRLGQRARQRRSTAASDPAGPRAGLERRRRAGEPAGAGALLQPDPGRHDRRAGAGAACTWARANATGLEWGARPAFLARQVSAHCEGGVLRVSAPRSASLKPSGSWTEQRMAPGFNLFYADLESDAARPACAALTQR